MTDPDDLDPTGKKKPVGPLFDEFYADDHSDESFGPCVCCQRAAPLIDDECPECRH